MSLIDHSACNLMKNAWNIQKNCSVVWQKEEALGDNILLFVIPSNYS